MGESKGEGGSWLYGIILMASGAFIVVTGIMNLLGYNPIADWLPVELQYLAGATSYLYIGIGAWGIIGGIGLIKDQEWGWGISLMTLSLVIIAFGADIITNFIAAVQTADWSNITMWVELAALIIAIVGIVYLLMTKEKYA